MNTTIIDKIDSIYTSHDIYKAIFITNVDNIEYLFDQLDKKDYPVCKKENVFQFNLNQYRILLLDLQCYNEIKISIDYTNISTIIYIGVLDKIEGIRNINHFFL